MPISELTKVLFLVSSKEGEGPWGSSPLTLHYSTQSTATFSTASLTLRREKLMPVSTYHGQSSEEPPAVSTWCWTMLSDKQLHHLIYTLTEFGQWYYPLKPDPALRHVFRCDVIPIQLSHPQNFVIASVSEGSTHYGCP